MSPTALSITSRAGETVTVSVRNADSAACATDTIHISVAKSSGGIWYIATLTGPKVLTLAPGATATTTVTVFTGSFATYGTYSTFRVTAAKAPDGGSGSAFFNAGLGPVPEPALTPAQSLGRVVAGQLVRLVQAWMGAA